MNSLIRGIAVEKALNKLSSLLIGNKSPLQGSVYDILKFISSGRQWSSLKKEINFFISAWSTENLQKSQETEQ